MKHQTPHGPAQGATTVTPQELVDQAMGGVRSMVPPQDLARVEQGMMRSKVPFPGESTDQEAMPPQTQNGTDVNANDNVIPSYIDYKDQALSLQELQQRRGASNTTPPPDNMTVPDAKLYYMQHHANRSNTLPVVAQAMIVPEQAQPPVTLSNDNRNDNSQPSRHVWIKVLVCGSLLFGAVGVGTALYASLKKDSSSSGNTNSNSAQTENSNAANTTAPQGGATMDTPFATEATFASTATMQPTFSMGSATKQPLTVHPTISQQQTAVPSMATTVGLTVLCGTQLSVADSCFAQSNCSPCLQDAYNNSIMDGTESTSWCASFQNEMCRAIQQDCPACTACTNEAVDYYECIGMVLGCTVEWQCDNSSSDAPSTTAPSSTPPIATIAPTLKSTTLPPTTASTTFQSTSEPTFQPTVAPTVQPSAEPTTFAPTTPPTTRPTPVATEQPTNEPTLAPTSRPRPTIPLPATTPAPTASDNPTTCTTQLSTLNYCILNTNCADCLNAARDALFVNADIVTCLTYETEMCEAIYENCRGCSGCVEEAEDFYRCVAVTNADCFSFRCPQSSNPPDSAPTNCNAELYTVRQCITEDSCGSCLDDAYGTLYEVWEQVPCSVFESDMCRAIYQNCDTCSGCEVDAEDYFRCVALLSGCSSFMC